MRRLICRQLAGWRAPDKCRLLFRAFTTAPSSKEERKKKKKISWQCRGEGRNRDAQCMGLAGSMAWRWDARAAPHHTKGCWVPSHPMHPAGSRAPGSAQAAVLLRPHPARLGAAASPPRQRAPTWGAAWSSPDPASTGYAHYNMLSA